MALFGSLATVRLQCPRTPAFGKAWAYVDELLRTGSPVQARVLALGAGASNKRELADSVYAIEQAYETKPRAEGFFEAHRKFIDIQIVVGGLETIEVADLRSAKVREPYDESRDLLVFQDVANASLLRLREGEAAVFFPVDVHMPSLRTETEPVLVKKVVLKVPVEA